MGENAGESFGRGFSPCLCWGSIRWPAFPSGLGTHPAWGPICCCFPGSGAGSPDQFDHTWALDPSLAVVERAVGLVSDDQSCSPTERWSWDVAKLQDGALVSASVLGAGHLGAEEGPFPPLLLPFSRFPPLLHLAHLFSRALRSFNG